MAINWAVPTMHYSHETAVRGLVRSRRTLEGHLIANLENHVQDTNTRLDFLLSAIFDLDMAILMLQYRD